MGHTQPGHPYVEPHNHASKGIHPSESIGGGMCGHLTNAHMNDVGHKSMKPGGGGRFAKLEHEGVSPALAGWIGRKKYGNKQMAKWSAAGRKKG